MFNRSVVLHIRFGVFQRQASKLEYTFSIMVEFLCSFELEALIFKMVIFINFAGLVPWITVQYICETKIPWLLSSIGLSALLATSPLWVEARSSSSYRPRQRKPPTPIDSNIDTSCLPLNVSPCNMSRFDNSLSISAYPFLLSAQLPLQQFKKSLKLLLKMVMQINMAIY